jgi:8-oxo-dGTP pyrophosphatase MutT (NUDIX family)
MLTHHQVTMAPLADASAAELLESRVFRDWYQRATNSGLRVQAVRVSAVFKWGNPREIKMIHMAADGTDADGRKLDGVTMLRGDTTDIVTVLVDDDGGEWIVLVVQPRLPGAQREVVSDPAGMIDAGEEPNAAALRELEEEIGGDGSIEWEVVDLNYEVTGSAQPMLISPGGSDERVYYALATGRLSNAKIAKLHNKFGGLEEEGERIQVLVVRHSEARDTLRRGGCVDLKALTGLLMYEDYRRQF